MKLSWRRISLSTRRPFTISAGSTTAFAVLIAELEHDGVVGFGEAAPSRRVTGETLDTTEAFLAWCAKELPGDPAGLDAFLDHVHDDICGNPSARAAFDLAAHDLLGKLEGRPARERYGLPAARIQTSMTVSLGEPGAMAAEARDYAARGFATIKLKLGDAARDVERVAAVRAALPGARLFADANQAWSVEEALRLAPALADLGVQFLEQPVQATDHAGLARLSRESALPVVADESVHDEHDLRRLLALGFRGGINLKLQKTGGLRPAVRALRVARDAGLRTMCGCNLETSVGIAGALQILALLDEADLDGNLLLADDPFATTAPDHGWLASPAAPGLGVAPAAGRWPPDPAQRHLTDQV